MTALLNKRNTNNQHTYRMTQKSLDSRGNVVNVSRTSAKLYIITCELSRSDTDILYSWAGKDTITFAVLTHSPWISRGIRCYI